MDKIRKKSSKSGRYKEDIRKVGERKTDPVNGWWYPSEFSSPNIDILNKEREQSRSPQYCCNCEKTWQKKPNNYSNSKTIRNSYDFYDRGTLPTYRLERRLCPLCSTI